jgi:protein SCO1/2
MNSRTIWVPAVVVVLASHGALAQTVSAPPISSGTPDMLRNVGFDQKLDEQVPLDLVFRDETGEPVKLSQYGDKPVVLALVYYKCPMLCNLVLNGLLKALRAMPFDAGKQFNVVTVSFDPRETPKIAAAKKSGYIQQYGRKGAAAGWRFLTGEEDSIRRLTRSVGFRYTFDPASNQYAHASGLVVLTPKGKVTRYLYGVEYSARDLQFSLMDAATEKIGSPVDQLLLYCFHYDPLTGKYGLAIMTAIRIGGVLTVLALGGFIVVMLRRERRRKAQPVLADVQRDRTWGDLR